MTQSFWVSRFNPAPFDAHMRIIAHIQPHARVLDIGCNTGELGEQLRKRLGCYVVGVEVQQDAAEFAKNRLDEVVCGDVQRLPDLYPFYDQFDYVIAADVLEHLSNPRFVTRLLMKYLTVGGKMIVSLPNVANYAVRLQLLRGRFDYNTCAQILSDGHLRFFTLQSAKALLQDAGLVVETVDVTPGLFVFQPYHLSIERIFGRWLWYRHLEYLISGAWKTLFAYQFIIVARKPEGVR